MRRKIFVILPKNALIDLVRQGSKFGENFATDTFGYAKTTANTVGPSQGNKKLLVKQ